MKKAVLISCFNWYDKRLRIIKTELETRGYHVTVLLSDFDHIKKQVITDRYPECTYLSVPKYKKNISLSRIYSHLVFGNLIKKQLKTESPDLIYLLVPPNNSASHCFRYKKKHEETTYIVDVIDLWPESFPLGRLKNMSIARKWRAMRSSSLAIADAVVLECDLYRNYIQPDVTTAPLRTLRLFSDYTEEDLLFAKQERKNHFFDCSSKQISFAYIGSLNSITDYAGIFSIVQEFISQEWKVSMQIIGDGSYKDKFLSGLVELGCQVTYHGLVFDKGEKIRLVKSCDFAFNLMIQEVSVGLTMKSLDYLSLGLPMINTIQGDTWDIIQQYAIGFNYKNNPAELLQQITEVDYHSMKASGASVLENLFTRQSFKKQVKELFDTVL